MWLVFFFRRKTAYEMRISDWSSDVCSSDLQGVFVGVEVHAFDREIGAGFGIAFAPHRDFGGGAAHIIERADLGADRPDVEGARHGSCPSLAGSAIWVMPGAAAISSTRLSTVSMR